MAELKEIKYIGNIRSQYIRKEVFTFLEEKQILKLIVYNKKFQNIFKVNIGNYKKVLGICRIVEKDGKGRDYIVDTNKLIFLGEYTNDKKRKKAIC